MKYEVELSDAITPIDEFKAEITNSYERRRIAAASIALGLPSPADLAKINIEKMTAADCATAIKFLDEALASARARMGELQDPVNEVRKAAAKKVTEAIHEAKGKKLPHDFLNVELTRSPGRRSNEDARLSDLFKLVDFVPADQLAPCLWIDSVDVQNVTPEAIEAISMAGGKLHWKCNLTKLDKLARDFGEDHPIAKIIKDATPRGPEGPEVLTITPRESAMKTVGAK